MEEFAALSALGLHAMKVPAADGGGGADNVGYALAMQALATACASTATLMASSNLTARILGIHATPEGAPSASCAPTRRGSSVRRASR